MASQSGPLAFLEDQNIYVPLITSAIIAFFMVVFYKRIVNKAVKKRISGSSDTPQHLNALISSLNDIIFEFNEDKVCLNVWLNELTERVTDPKQAIGKKLEELIGDERALKFNNALDYVIKNRKPITIQHPSDYGTNSWLQTKATPVLDRQGNYLHRISASVSDITEQKRNADELKEKELLLLEAQSVAKIGNWLFDSTTRETYFADNTLSILGIEDIPAGMEKHEYYLNLVHPDDREECKNFLFSVAGASRKEFEHRIITPEGELKYIKIIIGDKVFNDEGGLKRIFGIIQDITESKLSEKAIRKGRSELIEAQTIAKIGNWSWDISSHRSVCSDEIFNIFDIEQDMLTEWAARRLLLTYVHPNDKFILQHLFKNAVAVTNYTCVFRIITPGGATKYLSVIIGNLLKYDDGSLRKIVGTLQDITERKQVEIDYRRTENKFKLILETIKLAAVSLDNKGRIIFCNQYMANLLGYTQKEIIGMNWFDNFIPDETKEDIRTLFKTNNIPQQYINPILCKGNEQRVISWQNTASYDENGLLKEITGIGEDITDQQKATMELISAKELAEKASKFKSDFLSIMSHEIRTPMNAVIGTTNLLISDEPRPEQVEYLNILKFSGENLLAIINDILDYNKIEAGKLQLNEHPFNIYTVAQKIKQSFYARAVEKRLALELTIDNTVPELLTGDQVRLSQVLNNLIGNAIKFTNRGTIDIKLFQERLNSKEVTVKFTIADTGIGIAPENLGMIFDPFMQEPAVKDMDHGGTGLGLAITKRLLDLHNSGITVVSQPGIGTTFTFAITFKLPKKKEKDLANKIPASPMLNLHGMHILVVDDNAMNLLIASKFLTKWQARVDEALNGQLAVNMVNNNKYDLVIMDLQMPVMDGFEATEVIKRTHPHIPIIALTADAMPETYAKALASGMSDYLTKPFIPSVLFDKVSKYHNEIF
jgi:two-component system sensor histidine kinase/response regulator